MAKYAFLLGANTSPLRYAESDAQQVGAALASCGFSITRARGNRTAVLDTLARFTEGCRQSDTALLYFSCHAYAPRGSLFLRIAPLARPYALSDLPLSDVTTLLETCPSSRKLLILDCCSAGSAVRDWNPESTEAYRLLLAGPRLAPVKEFDSYQGSFLSHHIAAALTRRSDDTAVSTGAITVNSLAAWLVSTSQQEKSRGIPAETPILLGDLSADFPIAEGQIEPSRFHSLAKQFVHCLSASEHHCYGSQLWCRAISERTLGRGQYVIPSTAAYDNGRTNRLPVNRLFASWLVEGAHPNLALFGDFGVGKTSACLYLYLMLARRLAARPDTALIPVYVPLEVFHELGHRRQDVHGLVEHACKTGLSRARFSELLSTKRFVFILDGFDEMVATASLGGIAAAFASLYPFFSAPCKVLFTSRSHLFASSQDLSRVILGGGSGTDLLHTVRAFPETFALAELREFTPRQVHAMIRRRLPAEDPRAIWKELQQYYDLPDLCKRAMLLRLILDSLPVIRQRYRAGQTTNTAGLYTAYVDTWITRELETKELDVPADAKLRFAEDLAIALWASGKPSVHFADLRKMARLHYSDMIFTQADMQMVEYDTRNASFLNRDMAGNYRFMHKSFLEYFAARRCVTDLLRPARSLPSWRHRWFDREVARFVSQLVAEEGVQATEALLNMAARSRHGIELWNLLHVLSLLEPENLKPSQLRFVAQVLVRRGWRNRQAVLVRQYCRIAAKFVAGDVGSQLIDHVLALVDTDAAQEAENNRTYTSYYGGRDGAVEALLAHVATGTRKYDRRLHLHVLGQIGRCSDYKRLRDIITVWPVGQDRNDAAAALKKMMSRA